MTDQTNRIPLEEADAPTLRNFAMTLGLDIKNGTNASQMRGLILKALPECKDVPALPAAPEPIAQSQAAAPVAPAAPVSGKPADRPVYSAANPDFDPKVELIVHKTDDKRRAKDVTVSVGEFTCRIQRGQKVAVPYRIYRALELAVEKAAVDTDEINPLTGLPYIEWQEVQSYPFTITRMAPEDDVEAWFAAQRTDPVPVAA